MAEQRPSPLELPQQSYATAREFQEQRTREAKMKEVAEQFVGAPVVPTIGPQPGAAEAQPEGAEPAPKREARGESDEDLTDAERASEFAALGAQAAREAGETQEQQAARLEAEGQAAEGSLLKDAQKLSRYINGLSSLTIVGAIIAIVSMNFQLLNDLTIKSKLLPKPELPDKFMAVWVDCALCSAVIPLFCPSCLVLLLVALALYGLADFASYLGISV